MRIYRKGGKRLFDTVFSLICLIILSPVFLLVGIAVYLNLGKPILFIQERIGLNGKVFNIYKFRTMRTSSSESDTDTSRLTRFGSFLRATSLDELPELFNILIGDMSIIGPRPLLVKYWELYNDEQKKRHDIRPGLTGLAQINGRNNISWEEKFEFDLDYLANYSLLLDVKIFFMTIIKVFKSEGITQDGERTSSEFKGTKED